MTTKHVLLLSLLASCAIDDDVTLDETEAPLYVRGPSDLCIDTPTGTAGQATYMFTCNGGLNQEFDCYCP